jgi:protein TonB
MLNSPAMLVRALALSILLHAALIEGIAHLAPSPLPVPHRDAAALDVRLRDAPERAALQAPEAPIAPRLLLLNDSQAHASAASQRLLREPRDKAPQGLDGPPRGLSGAAARSAHVQLSRALLYPREAIEQGIEGEATVLLFLDESGNAIAARLEASSGHALLDDAAVRAARSLRALPGNAPREALLPVRFRLR